MNGETDDKILIERFLSGDEEGFEMLVRKYQDRVVNTVYSLGSHTQNAEDIAQEVFIKVYKNLKYFNQKSKFSTWLYRITVNTAYTFLKREQKYVILDRPEKIGKTEADSVREKAEQKEKRILIRKALQKLPFKYRTVLILRDIEELSYREIAKILGCFVGTVESRLFRARSLLKKALSSFVKKEDVL